MKKRIVIVTFILVFVALIAFCNYPNGKEIAKEPESVTIQEDTIIVKDTVADSVVVDSYVSENWLYGKLKENGIKEDDIYRFIYLAKRESSLNAKAHNTTLNRDKTVDTGLFQINTVHKDLYAKYDLFCPEQNLLAALELYRKSGFQPWFTLEERRHYRSGEYNAKKWRDYVPENKKHFIS